MSELKPCPFCGGKAITATFLDWDDLEYMAFEVNDSESIDGEVTCENEHCINGWWLTPEQWQTRPLEDALNKRIAELEAEHEKVFDLVRKLRMYCIYAHWDNPDTEDEFDEFDVEVCKWLSEYKVCDQLTAHTDIERQDDKSPNDTQTQAIVYGKESEE